MHVNIDRSFGEIEETIYDLNDKFSKEEDIIKITK
jgi:hypothetical protein